MYPSQNQYFSYINRVIAVNLSKARGSNFQKQMIYFEVVKLISLLKLFGQIGGKAGWKFSEFVEWIVDVIFNR